jgi:DNA-binding transcriptional MerR regulator
MDRYSLDELTQLVGLPVRTVRYYIQRGLVARPYGEKRGSWYGKEHLEQLLRIRQWTDAGISLERIAELLAGDPDQPPLAPARAGQVSLWSRVSLGAGLELHLDPLQAGLTPEQVQEIVKRVTADVAIVRQAR